MQTLKIDINEFLQIQDPLEQRVLIILRKERLSHSPRKLLLELIEKNIPGCYLIIQFLLNMIDISTSDIQILRSQLNQLDTKLLQYHIDWTYETLKKAYDICKKQNYEYKFLGIIERYVIKIDQADLGITMCHVLYLRKCLKNKAYKKGYEFVSQNNYYKIFHQSMSKELMKNPNNVEPQNYTTGQQYFYHSAVICIGLQKYKQGLNYLQICNDLYSPMMTQTLIDAKILEILIKLKIHGPNQRVKYDHRQINPYKVDNEEILKESLNHYFQFKNIETYQEFQKLLSKYEQNFKLDGYWDLVKELDLITVIRLFKQQKQFYTSVSFDLLKSYLGDVNANQLIEILEKVSQDYKKISIDEQNQVVIFDEFKSKLINRDYLNNLRDKFDFVLGLKGIYLKVCKSIAEKEKTRN